MTTMTNDPKFIVASERRDSTTQVYLREESRGGSYWSTSIDDAARYDTLEKAQGLINSFNFKNPNVLVELPSGKIMTEEEWSAGLYRPDSGQAPVVKDVGHYVIRVTNTHSNNQLSTKVFLSSISVITGFSYSWDSQNAIKYDTLAEARDTIKTCRLYAPEIMFLSSKTGKLYDETYWGDLEAEELVEEDDQMNSEQLLDELEKNAASTQMLQSPYHEEEAAKATLRKTMKEIAERNLAADQTLYINSRTFNHSTAAEYDIAWLHHMLHGLLEGKTALQLVKGEE